LRDRYQDSNETTLDSADLQSDDQKILDDYLASLQRDGAADPLNSFAGDLGEAAFSGRSATSTEDTGRE
jgi:hypothetical protein